jgi:hypothetical protein
MPDVFDHGSNSKWSERQDFHLRPEIERAGSIRASGPCHFNKEQTPLASLRYQPAVSRRLFRCLGHTSSEALKL